MLDSDRAIAIWTLYVRRQGEVDERRRYLT
jgi:hypothetical protein